MTVNLPIWIDCDISATLEVISGRWKSVILFYLLSGTRRFSEIKRFVPGITQRVLTAQLRELEADGIVSRNVYPVIPPKVEYSVTPFGRTLEPVLLSMCDWGREHKKKVLRVRTKERQPVVARRRTQLAKAR